MRMKWFARGMLVMALLQALVQDAFGKRAFLAFCEAHWTEIPWLVWVFVLAVLFSKWILFDRHQVE